MAGRADDLRPGDGGPDRDCPRGARLDRYHEGGFQVGGGRVTPHVVRVERRAADAELRERHGHLQRLIVPVHGHDGPPPRRALAHPDRGGPVAAHAPDPPGVSPAPGHSDGEDVLASPVDTLGRHGIATVLAGARGLPDLETVQERLVGVGDLAELEGQGPTVRRSDRPTGGGWKGESHAIPGDAGVPRMSCLVPALRYLNGLPRFLVESTRAVARIVTRPEAPRAAHRIHVAARYDGRSHGGPD